MNRNFLKLNEDKTEFLLIGSRQQLAKISVPHVTVGNSEVTSVSQARNLGAIFDSTMSLDSHVSNLVRSASLHIRNIGHIRKYLDATATEQIVHAFVTSRLDMGNSLLFGLPMQQINRLQRIQNSAARIIKLTRKSSHITPILEELHWLPVYYRIIYKMLLFVYKSLNGLAPAYLSELVKPSIPTRSLRSGNKNLLIEPKSNRSWGDRSFYCAAPRLWNALPLHMRYPQSLEQFKRSLKSHLFSQAFS